MNKGKILSTMASAAIAYSCAAENDTAHKVHELASQLHAKKELTCTIAHTHYSIKQMIEKETGKVVLSVEKCDSQKQYLMEAHIDDTGEYTEATLSYPRNDKNFEQLTEMIAPIHKVKGFVQETPMVKATHINHGLSAVLSKDAFFAHEYKEIVDTLYNRFHK